MLYPPINVRQLRQVVRDEVRQRAEEGCEVGQLGRRAEDAGEDRDRLLAVYEDLLALQPRPDFPFIEPSDLAGIRAARPAGGMAAARSGHVATPPRVAAVAPSHIDAAVADRIHGGWLGRCAGLMLGKPFESSPFVEDAQAIRRYLEAARAYPLDDYPPFDAAACQAVGRTDLPWPGCHRGRVRHVEPDDDIHYTIMGLEVLEKKGAAFTTADVAHWWTHRLPAADVFTAEEAAYRNLMLLQGQFEPHKLTPEQFEQVRTWMNPYREWIGAQIRADGWALACPGDPERAAEFAWRDASLSHVKNGVYGEMLCAAMIAAAAVCDNPAQIVQAGLAQIPEKCRLADAIRRTIDQCAALGYSAARFEDGIAWLWREFGHYHPIHTINNAAAVVAAVLLGSGDFGRTIAMAVMCGWDTDCNGATAGCICGTLLGAKRLPTKWIEPLNDTLRVNVLGYNPYAISGCARRQVEVARQVASSA
jgi:ADP-ribosylglycohydrolase